MKKSTKIIIQRWIDINMICIVIVFIYYAVAVNIFIFRNLLANSHTVWCKHPIKAVTFQKLDRYQNTYDNFMDLSTKPQGIL